jgi:hypothetical protein
MPRLERFELDFDLLDNFTQIFAASPRAISKAGDPEADQRTKILNKWFCSSRAGNWLNPIVIESRSSLEAL